VKGPARPSAQASPDLAGQRDRRLAQASGGTNGIRRVIAELTFGRDIVDGHSAVESIMRELGIRGVPNRRLPKGARLAQITSLDLWL